MTGPIFIGGCARSGTTLLQILLDRHPDVTLAFETLFPVTIPYRDFDWPLVESARLARRILPELDPRTASDELGVEGLSIAVDGARSWSECCRSAIGYLRSRRTSRWGVKSPFLQFHVDAALERFEDARLIFTVRDGRDTCASLMERVPSLRQADAAARWWRRSLHAIERAARRYPRRVRWVRYEDLVREPERELRRLCAFADLQLEPCMLDDAPITGVPAPPPGVFLSPRITADRVGRSRKTLSDLERLVVDTTLSADQLRWGYAVPAYLEAPAVRAVARLASAAVLRPTWPARHFASHLFESKVLRGNRG